MSENQAIYQEIELNLKKIFSYKTPKLKNKTGYAMYAKLYEITKLIGELGLIQEKISNVGKNAHTLSDLTVLKEYKSDFQTKILEIGKNWLDIATILNLKTIISELIKANKNTTPNIEMLLCKTCLIDEVNNEILEAENISFYIFLLLDTISTFADSAKNLALLVTDDTSFMTTEILEDFFAEEENDEEDEDLNDTELFLLSLKDFSFLLLLIKFIAYKFGINFESTFKEYLANN